MIFDKIPFIVLLIRIGFAIMSKEIFWQVMIGDLDQIIRILGEKQSDLNCQILMFYFYEYQEYYIFEEKSYIC